LIGRTIAHYKITDAIGAGGMGEVYRATDTKLSRDVALKVLPVDMARDPERLARFQREARAVAALNHPNIVTIFSVEEFEGLHFITMELVEGRSLDRLIPSGGLSADKIVEIAQALCGALAAAHEKGIIHRDLKPANVMVTADGRVKVLDFGLAKETRAANSADATMTSASNTKAGVVMGTPAYMSPEQIAGRAVDYRTDIFSLGVVLYEMSTGRRPFEAQSSAELASSILRDTPPLVTDARSDLPADLARIIQHCLVKNAPERFASAQEIRSGLRGVATTPAPVRAPALTSSRAATQPDSGSARADEGFWLAVLPFKYTGGNADIASLADGLSEEIVTGLSRFSYLRVIARGSTSRYAGESVDVRAVGRELGARYLMEGSLRQAGSTVRAAVQLVDAATGANLWAETFDRTFSPEAVFEIQDDLVPRIVSTVADTQGVLPRTMGEAVRFRDPGELSPYEALLLSFVYMQRANAEEHAAARAGLERALQQAPGNTDCLAMLSILEKEAYAHGFNVRPDSLARAFAAAQRAVEAAPSNSLAYHALAAALFFRREIRAFRSAAERAITLNPMDGFTSAYLGMLTAFSGDWERGCALAERGMQLNPHSPRWYRFPSFFDAYRKKDYRGALEIVLKINMSGFWRTNLALAVAQAQLGDLQAARNAVRQLIELKPNFAGEARAELGKWWDPELVEHLIDGLRKAGLEIAPEKGAATPAPASAAGASTASTAAGKHAIAVLPFQNLSGDSEQEYFADGITEEIINALAHIPGLRVAGRSSSFSFKGRHEDLRSVGSKLGVGTILEGTLRRSGDRLRITAQLIDAGNGYQLWSERYERVIDDVFAVQDEIASTIAGRLQLSLKLEHGGQPAQPPTRNIAAYELYLKGRALLYQRGLSIPKAINCFTQAVALDPAYAQAWAGLADGYTTSGYSGFKPAAEVMPRALEAARRALQLDPDLAEAHSALACATLLYELNYDLAGKEFQRALQLNPSYPQARAWYGLFFLQWISGRAEEARQELLRLLQLDPLSAYANVILSFSCSSGGRFQEAVDHARRGVELDSNSYLAYWSLMTALHSNGQHEEAAAAGLRALEMSGHHSWALATLVSVYAAWNKPEKVLAVSRELQARSEREYIQPAMLAPAAAAAGDMDRAIALAQRAVDEKDPLFVMLARTWPIYDQLRKDSRFLEILTKLRLPNWDPAREQEALTKERK
jgi:TolB-like protein/Tfp pilus assembly protein PilF